MQEFSTSMVFSQIITPFCKKWLLYRLLSSIIAWKYEKNQLTIQEHWKYSETSQKTEFIFPCILFLIIFYI